MTFQIFIANNVEALEAVNPTHTVEAEFGDSVVEGSSVTLAHHGKRAENLPTVENTTIGISHFDLDTLGGVMRCLGVKDYDGPWKEAKDNDRIDNLLLHALYRGAVHFLITNDKEIHKKARKEQVHRLDQFLSFLQGQTTEEPPPPYVIQECFLHEFDVNQPFFDSLREGYEGFNQWYLGAAADHRKAWCIHVNGTLQAICIHKHEDRPIIIDNGSPLDGNAMKLCTFKVGASIRGRKFGERLLFSAFKYTVEHGIPYIYLHTYGKEHEMLVSLCQDYGFEFAGKYLDRDDVYIKTMSAPHSTKEQIDPLTYAVTYYPNYLDSDIQFRVSVWRIVC